MRLFLFSFVLFFGLHFQVAACSIYPEEIPFCQYTKYDNGMIARGKILKKIRHGVVMELYEVYRGDETRCEIRIFERPNFDCNGILFKYNLENLGEVGQIVLFQATRIESPESSWEEEGEYRNQYSEIVGFGRLTKPLIQTGDKVKGFFSEGVNSVRVDKIFEKLVDCEVEGLLVSPRKLCSEYPLTIYPNPAQEYLYIVYEGMEIDEISIYDISGRRAAFSKNYSEDGISVKDLTSGVYIVVVKSAGVIFKQKLLVTK